MYNAGNSFQEQHHVSYHIDGQHPCGVIVDNGTVFTMHQSSIDQSEFLGGDHLTSGLITNALVCVVGAPCSFFGQDASY